MTRWRYTDTRSASGLSSDPLFSLLTGSDYFQGILLLRLVGIEMPQFHQNQKVASVFTGERLHGTKRNARNGAPDH